MTDDANSLFERHSVDELHEILLKIKAEADKKKYDLRRLVGASYRDVIDAANAIGNMKSSSQLLVDQLVLTEGLGEMRSLKIPIKSDESKKNNLDLFCIAAKVRLLLITPEQIWNSMEKLNYLNSAYLFLISRLVYSTLSDVNTNFPIMRDLWNSINPLKLQIIEKASQNIMSTNLTSTELCSSLYSLGILKDSTMQDLFHLFLDIRRQKILANLTLKSSSDLDIINHIFEFISCLKQTYKDIHDFFFIPQFADFLKSDLIIHGLTPSLFSKMYSGISNISVLFRYLPDSTKHFSKFLKNGPPLSSTYVLNFSSIWLESMKKSIEERLVILLGHIKTGVMLASVQKNFAKFPKTSLIVFTNEENSLNILQSDDSIWNSFLKAPILERSKSILEVTFDNLFSLLKEEITRQSLSHSDLQKLAPEIWSKGLDETQISNAHNANFMIPPVFLNLDKNFLSIVEKCINEVLPLLKLQNSSSFSELAHFHFSTALEKFENNMKDSIADIEMMPNLNTNAKIDRCLFIGKSLSILSNRLAGFKVLFGNGFEQSKPKYSFNVLILSSRRLWIESFISFFANIIKNGLIQTDWIECSSFLHLWEDVPDSKSPFSCLPVRPSIFISKALFHICEEINRIDSFSVETFCSSSYIDAIIEAFITNYTTIIPTLSISNNGYIQMQFDISYVMKTLGGQTEKSHNMDISALTSHLSQFEKNGDTILIDSLLKSGIEKACFQQNSLYNLLLLNQSAIGTTSKSISEKKHMLLSVSSGIPRFNLLPIPTPSLINMTSKDASFRSSIFLKTKPRSNLILKPPRKTISHIPSGKQSTKDDGGTRVHGLMSAVASTISQQPKATSELLTSASNFISGFGLSLAASSNQFSNPKKS